MVNKANFNPVADEQNYQVTFTVPKDFGKPGALIITNNHPNEFYLKNVLLEAADKSTINFPANAWVYNHKKYPKDRAFFANDVWTVVMTRDRWKLLSDMMNSFALRRLKRIVVLAKHPQLFRLLCLEGFSNRKQVFQVSSKFLAGAILILICERGRT